MSAPWIVCSVGPKMSYAPMMQSVGEGEGARAGGSRQRSAHTTRRPETDGPSDGSGPTWREETKRGSQLLFCVRLSGALNSRPAIAACALVWAGRTAEGETHDVHAPVAHLLPLAARLVALEHELGHRRQLGLLVVLLEPEGSQRGGRGQVSQPSRCAGESDEQQGRTARESQPRPGRARAWAGQTRGSASRPGP